MKFRELGVALLIVAAGLFMGCASLPISNGDVAQIIITQLEATLDSVEAALVELKPDSDNATISKIKVIVAIAKPQIIAWISTIEQLRGADDQYNELKARVDAVMPRIDEILAE